MYDYDKLVVQFYEDYKHYIVMGDFERADMLWRAIERLDNMKEVKIDVLAPNPNAKDKS